MSKNTSTKMFHFSISADVSLEVDDIWPDGNAPENPTVADVLRVIAGDGGAKSVISDWSIDRDLTLTVSDDKNSEVAP